MSFSFSGASNSRLSRASGNVGTTVAMTKTFWVKRTSNFTGLKCVMAIRPTGDTTGHDLICNDPGFSAYDLDLQVNFATAQAVGDDPLALNVWTFVAIVGSGANISLKYWDGSAISTETVGQTGFTIANWMIGDAGAGTAGFVGKLAHLRCWNAALNDAELEAEMLSETPVRSANRLSAASGGGGSIAVALAGQEGTGFTNAGGVTYDSDMPTFDTFDGIVVSGESQGPSVGEEVTSRTNYCLYSGTLSNAAWAKQGNELVSGAATPPTSFGTAQRVLFKVTTGGVYQSMTGLPAGRSVAVMAARKVGADYVMLRHMNSTFSAGAQGIFNLTTGLWATQVNFGGITDGAWGSRSLGGGWYLIWIGATITGNRILEFYPTTAAAQAIAVDHYLDVCGFQYEGTQGGIVKATHHKPTTSAAVTRTLASITTTLSVSTIGAGQTATATAQLLDNASAPWDQYGPVSFTTENSAIATVSATSTQSDTSGRVTATVIGVSTGSADITALVDDLSGAIEVTVSGTSIARWVRIIVEGGWQGTSGWNVAVWRAPTTTRFPSAAPLFEVSGQKFNDALFGTRAYMDVAVPSSVSVTVGEEVHVSIENDNIGGKAVDGPGIFPAEVI